MSLQSYQLPELMYIGKWIGPVNVRDEVYRAVLQVLRNFCLTSLQTTTSHNLFLKFENLLELTKPTLILLTYDK